MSQSDEGSPQSSARERDKFLPVANINRIMKKAVPPVGKISQDAKNAVQECVSRFISFVTSEASDKCQKERRKTVNGDDLLCAIQTLGFDNYNKPLTIYIYKCRELEVEAKASAKIQNGQFAKQGSFTQAINFMNSQAR